MALSGFRLPGGYSSACMSGKQYKVFKDPWFLRNHPARETHETD